MKVQYKTTLHCLRLYLSKIIIVLLVSCSAEELIPPVAHFDYYPKVGGDTSTFYRFDASRSVDEDSESWQLFFRWDFEGDGIWDTDITRNQEYIWRYDRTGEYEVRLEVTDKSDLSSTYKQTLIVGINFPDSVIIDPRDGQEYHVVRLDHLWWMAEDLRYGIIIDTLIVPEDNQVTEKYVNPNLDSEERRNTGYYTWGELTDYDRKPLAGICPDGWRILSLKDYRFITRRFAYFGDAIFYFKPGGYLGLDLFTNGAFSMIEKSFYIADVGYHWFHDTEIVNWIEHHAIMQFGYNYFPAFMLSTTSGQSYPKFWPYKWGNVMDFKKLALNVRCVKDAE